MSPTQPRWRSVLAVAAHCDDHLSGVDEDTLANDVATALQATDADSVIVFDVDGVTGHPDHRRATQAALAAAVRGVPVLRCTVPASVATTLEDELWASFSGHDPTGTAVAVDRSRHSRAVTCHPIQAVSGSVLCRRLELTDDRQCLRHLSGTQGSAAPTSAGAAGAGRPA